MPEKTEDSSLAELIGMFERRALTRRCESYAVLATILLLIGLGAWVFVRAKEITSRETESNPQSIKGSLQARRAILAANIMELAAGVTNVLSDIGTLLPYDRAHSPAKYNVNLVATNGFLREKNDIFTELSNDLQRTGYNYIDYEARLRNESLPSIRI